MKKEPLIERLIKQLQAAGITDITVVVGFMKEQYEYLMDDYQVKLAVNRDYATKIISIHYNVFAGILGNTLYRSLWLMV